MGAGASQGRIHSVLARSWREMLPYVAVGMMAIILSSITGFYWAYVGRVGLSTAQFKSCQDDIRDRRSDILVRATQAWSTQQVASDPKQSARTRRARSIEAAQDRQSVADRLTRIDDPTVASIMGSAKSGQIRELVASLDTGRRLDCAEEHPPARFFP